MDENTEQRPRIPKAERSEVMVFNCPSCGAGLQVNKEGYVSSASTIGGSTMYRGEEEEIANPEQEEDFVELPEEEEEVVEEKKQSFFEWLGDVEED